MPDDVYGYTIFCDDIRHEINAKLSYVGAFASVIKINGGLPAPIPKLCLSVYFYEWERLAITRNWEVPLVVIAPGQSLENPSASIMIPVFPRDMIESASKQSMPDDEEKAYAVGNFHIIFSPLVITARGWIRVRAIYKDNIIKLGSLIVDQALDAAAG
jgi:hypothetical protein